MPVTGAKLPISLQSFAKRCGFTRRRRPTKSVEPVWKISAFPCGWFRPLRPVGISQWAPLSAVMILIVTLFEHALKMKMEGPIDLLNFAGSIALVGLALFLMHKGESHAEHAAPEEEPHS